MAFFFYEQNHRREQLEFDCPMEEAVMMKKKRKGVGVLFVFVLWYAKHRATTSWCEQGTFSTVCTPVESVHKDNQTMSRSSIGILKGTCTKW